MVGERVKILIVEDQPEIAEVLQEMLCDEYDVSWVDAVPPALSSLEANPPDVLLSDCRLEHGIAPLLAQADAADVAVVLMSGCPNTLDEFAAEGRRTLTKPFTLDSLFGTLRGALSEELPPPAPPAVCHVASPAAV